MTTTDTHPSWCDQPHDGPVHSGIIGDVQISGQPMFVGILQTGDGDPDVTVAGARVGVVQVDRFDCEDMAALLEVCGQDGLAALVRRAAGMLQEAGR